MKIEFGYGKSRQVVNIPDNCVVETLISNNINHKLQGQDAVKYALKNPIAAKCLCEYNLVDKKIAIITSDISRPLPSWLIIPLVLDELYAAGASKHNITIVLALGSHRNHTKEEMIHLVGKKSYEEVCVVDSDINNCVNVGKTNNGTPADFDKRVVDADFRICLGNIEFHYFAGYSGGYKALMPGVSTPNAIQKNHKLMVNENSCAGKLKGNPVRKDIEEAGSLLGCDYIVNAVLDEHKNIVYCVAGDVYKAHAEGCRYLNKMYFKQIPKKADIVIVSQGGAPKDANLYQTQKALDNAKHAVADGGTIILIGECIEGFGSLKFEEWLINAPNPKSMISKIKQNFELGGHKAAAIAMILEKADIMLVSKMDKNTVSKIFMKPYDSAQCAFDDAIQKYSNNCSVIAMPYGGSTLPILINNN